MNNFAKHVAAQTNLTEEDQQKAGTPVGGDMDQEHKEFLKRIERMMDSGEIDVNDPKSFLKMDVYETMPEEWQDKSDLALQNIASQLQRIYDLHISKNTPAESPQYQTMIEHLWQMKQSIEEHYDVFTF